jgi:hypothetical protein
VIVDVRRAEVEAYVDSGEEQVDERREVMSPSGRYRLLIRSYHREPCWDYTRGTVTRVADGAELADIKRNYPVFHHAFAAKGDREYLIAGHAYTSQTIVDLDGAAVYEPPGDHYDPQAFCWALARPSPDGRTLAVDGCFWGCHYEYRFYDFTDPARGWPHLPIASGDRVDVTDGKPPVWIDDTTFECYQTRPGPDGELEVAVRTRLARDGDTMVIVARQLSMREMARRAAEAAQAAAIDAWWAAFSTGDPMYLAMQAAIRAHGIPDDDYTPAERRVVKFFRRADPRASADLIWDVGARIAVRSYGPDGRRGPDTEFPHTVAGIEAAIAAVAAAFTAS